MKFLTNFRSWLTPTFTTTTEDDVIVALAVMMGTMRDKFRYACWFKCGIPSVTLLGQKEDYEDMMERVQMIKDGGYGSEAEEFGHMAERVLSGFLVTFENPNGEEAKSFLRCMIWNAGRGWEHECDGRDEEDLEKRGWYQGWITVFCYWDETGEVKLHWNEAGLPEVDGSKIPGGFTQIPVVLEDVEGVLDAEMVAGSIGVLCSSSGLPSAKICEDGMSMAAPDTVQAHSGWFVYEKGTRPSGNDFLKLDSDEVRVHVIPGG